MAIVLAVLSNIGSAFFLMSGLWTDLLLIRIFLSCAYIFLIAIQFKVLNVNLIIWGFVTLYVQLSSVVRLILDEGPVQLDENEELLWRVFYRSSGLSRLLFKKHVSKYFQLVEVKPETKLDTEEYVGIILDGVVRAEITINRLTLPIKLGSGEIFDLKHVRFFQRIPSIYSSIRRKSSLTTETIAATTMVDSKIFMCKAQDMTQLSSKPNLKTAWMGLLICLLSDIGDRPFRSNNTVIISDEESPMSTMNNERSAIFSPLEEWEKPPSHLWGSGNSLWVFHKHLFFNLKVTFQLPWPFMPWVSGIRHIDSLPVPHCENLPCPTA